MATAGNWLLKLRCYKCGSVFTVRRIPSAQIVMAADATACPQCGAGAEKPHTAPGHFVVEILPDPETL